MSFQYKNPISPNQLSGQQSVDRSKTYGTNFSTLSTGGYMEVFSLNELYYTVPPLTYGPIEYTGNTIPITYSKGSGTTFSYDTLILHSDNISSGRRKLGMLVYVYEQNQIYQFLIDNYETLWNSATGSTGTTIISEFGTTMRADSIENISFMSGWTANTISGVSGETNSTAVWKVYSSPVSFTGNTSATCINDLYVENLYGCSPINVNDLLIGNSGVTTTSLTAITISATTYLNLPSSPSGSFTGGTVTGATNFTNGLTANTISATTYDNLPQDIFVSGGTYDNSIGTATFTNTSGGTFNVVGFFTGYTNIVNTLTTGIGLSADTSSGNITIINTSPDEIVTLSGGTGISTGGTYPNFTITNSLPDQTVVLNSGTNINVTGSYPNFTIDVTGLTDNDRYVTGFSYNNNTFTISDNSGSTFNSTINVMTGLTVNGTLSATTYSGLGLKSNTVAGTSFTGNPKIFDVVFVTAYPNTNYSIQITGGISRTFTYANKTTTGFRINSNANPSFTENVDWVTKSYGEN